MKSRVVMLSALLSLAVPSLVLAKVSAEQAAHLGKDLTPIGATAAGNADGSIPAWTPAKQHGKLSGEYASDPKIESDKPLYTITGADLAKYGDKLSEGHKYLLKTFKDYKMTVYPSHRTVAWPEFIYKATAVNATSPARWP